MTGNMIEIENGNWRRSGSSAGNTMNVTGGTVSPRAAVKTGGIVIQMSVEIGHWKIAVIDHLRIEGNVPPKSGNRLPLPTLQHRMPVVNLVSVGLMMMSVIESHGKLLHLKVAVMSVLAIMLNEMLPKNPSAEKTRDQP